MGNKNKGRTPILNILKIPIYSVSYYNILSFAIQMELFGDYIYLGGGGGYEIANKIQVYTLPSAQDKLSLLTNLVHEEMTDKAVANYLMAAKDVSVNYLLTLYRVLTI